MSEDVNVFHVIFVSIVAKMEHYGLNGKYLSVSQNKAINSRGPPGENHGKHNRSV